MVYCKLQINEIHNSHTPFPKFLYLPSIDKTCSAGAIKSTNFLVEAASEWYLKMPHHP